MAWFADRGRTLLDAVNAKTPSRCDTMATAVCGGGRRAASRGFCGL